MKTVEVVRRRPRQARSESTVDTIYEAAMQIIEREGAERLTTKRIAEVSGFSIGTFYQYFHDRDSLLLAMAVMHRDRLIHALDALLKASRAQSAHERLSRLVAAVVADARNNRKTRRAVNLAIMRKSMGESMWDVMGVLGDYLARRLSEIAGADGLALSPSSQFVLSRSLTCVLCSAVMEESHLLDSQEIEDQLRDILAGSMIRD